MSGLLSRLGQQILQRISTALQSGANQAAAPPMRDAAGELRATGSNAVGADRHSVRAVEGHFPSESPRHVPDTPPATATGYRPSREELEMRRGLSGPDPGRRVDSLHGPDATLGNDLERGQREKQVYRAESSDGSRYVVKPFTGEIRTRACIPAGGGAQGAREVATYRVDHLLGWDLVPPAGIADNAADFGPSAVMKFVESDEARSLEDYDIVDRHRMAVLDYITGNTDRHAGNYRTVVESDRIRPVAIDHSLTFPEYRDTEFGIRSDFISHYMNDRGPDAPSDGSLHSDVLRDVRALHPDQLRSNLGDLGLSDDAIKGAVDRLVEIQQDGKITGREWRPGIIV
ncbi:MULTISPECIES: hypothetical protein [unclassified Nocardia]|uniref:hypothetical protein n=1 Tax=unclassified Nocardia TaxID=2637762 RepID=UPI00278C2517|nr:MULTISPECIES: hypothetical protein [unclassified Nocardia]